MSLYPFNPNIWMGWFKTIQIRWVMGGFIDMDKNCHHHKESSGPRRNWVAEKWHRNLFHMPSGVLLVKRLGFTNAGGWDSCFGPVIPFRTYLSTFFLSPEKLHHPPLKYKEMTMNLKVLKIWQPSLRFVINISNTMKYLLYVFELPN